MRAVHILIVATFGAKAAGSDKSLFLNKFYHASGQSSLRRISSLARLGPKRCGVSETILYSGRNRDGCLVTASRMAGTMAALL